MTKPAIVSDDPLIMKVRRALKAIEPRKMPTDIAHNKYGHACWVCPYCGDLILRKERWNSYRFSPAEKWNWGNYNTHFTAKHGTPFWKEKLLIEIIGADLVPKAKLDEAADIHREGFNIRVESGAASVVSGSTELDRLLNIIERRHGKDMVLHVGGKHNAS